MASVFLSYDREDADRARSVAEALEKAGHAVWWDRHIKGGSQFNKEIEEALARAEAVVVLWSAHSVESAWVRDEAAVGRDSGRLVPVRIDSTKPPLGFRQFQTVDLSGRRRRLRNAELQDLLAAIAAVGAIPAQLVGSTGATGIPPKIGRWWAAAALLAVVLIGAGYFVWTKLHAGSSIPRVAVVAVDPSAEARGLSRDLLVKLTSLQTSQIQAVRIVDSERDADFVFRLSAQHASDREGAGLDLLSKRDNAVLWSRDFVQPSGRRSDLQQQIAFTAARLLQCALDVRDPARHDLDQQTIKLYLNGCAQLDEIYGAGGRSVVPLFHAVVQKSPKFKPAWGKLLLAEASVLGQLTEDQTPEIRTHILKARKLDPSMPEATIAEVALLPLHSFAEALMLLDRANQQNPDNALVLSIRGDQLLSVGRRREAIEDTKRAVELDPLSPSTRASYVLTLAYGGRIDAAKKELHQFELLWPGTGMLQELQFRFHLRFGDPQKALQMAKSLDIGGENQERFLIARANPTKENIDRMILEARRDERVFLGFMVQALGELHRDEQSFELLMNWPNRDDVRSLGNTWFRPALGGVRSDPRFMKLASEVGLLAYWKQSGKWPDFCFEPDLPYDCKEEAAKLAA